MCFELVSLVSLELSITKQTSLSIIAASSAFTKAKQSSNSSLGILKVSATVVTNSNSCSVTMSFA